MEHGYYDSTPKAELSVRLTADEYQAARVLISRRFGRLKNAPFLILIGAALILLGVSGLFYQNPSVSAVILMAVLAALGGVLIFLYVSYFPTSIAGAAEALVKKGGRPGLPYEVKLYRDTFEMNDAYGNRIGYYSEQRACLETKELIILCSSAEQAPVILPKRCFEGQEQEICELLQQAFGRRYLK